jgi:hypothetical protein
MRASNDIQFAPVPEIPPPPPPAWLKALGEFLQSLFEPLGRLIGLSWPVMQYVLIALAALGVLFIAWRLIAPLLVARALREADAVPDWTPDRAEAAALLEDADRLAREGRFDEAAHLLLRRSVGQIAATRPGWLHPASTAREIAALPAMPEAARYAFAVIAQRVERSRFALRPLAAEDWQAARDAYARFALERLDKAESAAGAAA